MSLKATMHDDIRDVFLNTEDFAETHIVAGKPLTCVFYAGSVGVGDAAMGTVHDTQVLHAATEDLPGDLQPGKKLVVDGSIYEVTDIREDYGMTVLRLVTEL